MGQIANKMLFDAVASAVEKIKAKKANAELVTTERLVIRPASDEDMEKLISDAPDAELKKAYGEMLAMSKEHPKKRLWYTAWSIELCDGTQIGDLCFKGLSEDGTAELGYGVAEEYRNRGYAAEAVSALVEWAFRQPGVVGITAETEASNTASRRVLEKTGFAPTGETGEEGPLYLRRKKD